MRGQDRVRLHVYSPRLSLSNRSLEDLSFCAVPPVPESWSVPTISTTLNLFSGQLYIRDAEDYISLCRFLGVRFQDPNRGVEVGTDGFIIPRTRHMQDDEIAAICKFTSKPLTPYNYHPQIGTDFYELIHGQGSQWELVKAIDFVGCEEDDDPMDIDDATIVVKQDPDLMRN